MADELKKVIGNIRDKLDESLKGIGQLEDLSKKAGMRKADVVLALGALITFFIFFFAKPSTVMLFSNIVALGPVIDSIKAARSQQTGDDTQWLIYWILFGAGAVVEGLAFMLFGRDECRDAGGLTLYTTVYFASKVGFYLWAGYAGGATKVYNVAILPLFNKYFPERKTQ